MTTIADLVGSQRLAIVEALAFNDHTGLTCPGLIAATGVPHSTVPRLVKELESREIIVQVGKEGKAAIYRLNSANLAVVEMVRSLNEYPVRLYDAEEAKAKPAPTVEATAVAPRKALSLPPLQLGHDYLLNMSPHAKQARHIMQG